MKYLSDILVLWLIDNSEKKTNILVLISENL